MATICRSSGTGQKIHRPACRHHAEHPAPRVHNFGGFSDGDRAVFAADALGAKTITLFGFDLDDKNVDPVKRGKLMWAKNSLC